MKTFKPAVLAVAFLMTILNGSSARADFLGLAPGDYDVRLLDTEPFCGGVNCVGQVLIPTGVADVDSFAWHFVVAGDDYLWSSSSIRVAASSADGTSTCAQEALSATFAQCNVNANNESLSFLVFPPPALALGFLSAAAGDPDHPMRVWRYRDADNLNHAGAWEVVGTNVPEPGTTLLIGAGLAGVLFSRVRKQKVDARRSVGLR